MGLGWEAAKTRCLISHQFTGWLAFCLFDLEALALHQKNPSPSLNNALHFEHHKKTSPHHVHYRGQHRSANSVAASLTSAMHFFCCHFIQAPDHPNSTIPALSSTPIRGSSWCTQAEMSSTAVSYSFECFTRECAASELLHVPTT